MTSKSTGPSVIAKDDIERIEVVIKHLTEWVDHYKGDITHSVFRGSCRTLHEMVLRAMGVHDFAHEMKGCQLLDFATTVCKLDRSTLAWDYPDLPGAVEVRRRYFASSDY